MLVVWRNAVLYTQLAASQYHPAFYIGPLPFLVNRFRLAGEKHFSRFPIFGALIVGDFLWGDQWSAEVCVCRVNRGRTGKGRGGRKTPPVRLVTTCL